MSNPTDIQARLAQRDQLLSTLQEETARLLETHSHASHEVNTLCVPTLTCICAVSMILYVHCVCCESSPFIVHVQQASLIHFVCTFILSLCTAHVHICPFHSRLRRGRE